MSRLVFVYVVVILLAILTIIRAHPEVPNLPLDGSIVYASPNDRSNHVFVVQVDDNSMSDLQIKLYSNSKHSNFTIKFLKTSIPATLAEDNNVHGVSSLQLSSLEVSLQYILIVEGDGSFQVQGCVKECTPICPSDCHGQGLCDVFSGKCLCMNKLKECEIVVKVPDVPKPSNPSAESPVPAPLPETPVPAPTTPVPSSPSTEEPVLVPVKTSAESAVPTPPDKPVQVPVDTSAESTVPGPTPTPTPTPTPIPTPNSSSESSEFSSEETDSSEFGWNGSSYEFDEETASASVAMFFLSLTVSFVVVLLGLITCYKCCACFRALHSKRACKRVFYAKLVQAESPKKQEDDIESQIDYQVQAPPAPIMLPFPAQPSPYHFYPYPSMNNNNNNNNFNPSPFYFGMTPSGSGAPLPAPIQAPIPPMLVPFAGTFSVPTVSVPAYAQPPRRVD